MVYKLISGSDRHRGSPETFWIPPDSEKSEIAPGDYAKLIFSSGEDTERMWVLVTARDGDSLSGTLCNVPYRLAIKHGDPVEFGPDHVIQIIKEGEKF